MKTYIVTFTPNDTAPVGELGKPDVFGFMVTTKNAVEAIEAARVRFDRSFPEMAAHYVATDIEKV